MLVAIKQYWEQALYNWFENIDKALGSDVTAYRLLTTCHGMSSDSYHHQSINNFEKLLDLENAENTSMIIAPILLVLHIHIGPTWFLEGGVPNAKFDVDKRLYIGSTGLD